MKQTLLLIPLYWVMIVWAIGSLLMIAWMYKKHGWSSELIGFLPMAAIAGALIYFALPYASETIVDAGGKNHYFVPIRGYGFFLLIATLTGVGLAAWRARRLGFNPDDIFSLAFCMFILGIGGARLFYVIQKFDSMDIESFADFVRKTFEVTEGGLVVYGGLIGALIGFVGFVLYKRLPMFEIADIIAPSMIIGLAIGRLGCFMNGCCFGGLCTVEPVAVHFPAGSPPYMRQLESGELLGIHGKMITPGTKKTYTVWQIDSVDAGSIAESYGLQAGEKYTVFNDSESARNARAEPERGYYVLLQHSNGESIKIPYINLPERSLGVQPTQIYSAINAALIFCFLWFLYPFRQQPGQIFAVLMMIYPITRIILEFIRSDEDGVFGTPFTISQWVSAFIFVLGISVYIYIMSHKESTTKLAAKA
jgi:phosphatidylglycerol:prolipoprotein diacylglycerol transferase